MGARLRSAGRVLVVDDDEAVRVLLTRYLEMEGFEVEPVPDGGTALAAIASWDPTWSCSTSCCRPRTASTSWARSGATAPSGDSAHRARAAHPPPERARPRPPPLDQHRPGRRPSLRPLTGPVLACDRLGHGPPVVLVHGVGIGPWSFAALAGELGADHEVVVAHRRGYGGSGGLPPAGSLAGQVEDLARLAGGRAAFVGVSGGATLVLALALAHPGLVSAAVVHEPVVGALAPDLHGQLRAAAHRLSSSPEEAAGAVRFVRDLVGPDTWDALDPAQISDVAARAAVIRAEVPQFVAFSPTPVQLRALAPVALVSSVGGSSASSRHAAAAAVAAPTDQPPVVLAGVGHLAQVEDPHALARALREVEAQRRQSDSTP